MPGNAGGTPREVVAQVLDYGSWVQTLTDEQVREPLPGLQARDGAGGLWTDAFGGNPPEVLNGGHRLTVVASDLDPRDRADHRHLAGRDVRINVVFFRYFTDEGRSYLART